MNKYDEKLRNEVRGTTRKFKEIDSARILDIEQYGILPIGTDEIFVLVKDSNTFYISNYGRAVEVTDKPRLVNGFTEKNKRLIYKLPVWKNAEREIIDRYADYLVVDTFMYHANKKIWHAGNNKEDNYYLNLYPVNMREHAAIRKYVKTGGIDTEDKINEIIEHIMYEPTALGVGYWGTRNVDTYHWIFRRWCDMLMRCYSDSFQNNQPSYMGCTVCEEWHNYANFKKWVEENFYEVDDERMELDKDILIKGNTVYSPDTCVFVPHSVNSLLVNRKALRGEFPVGVDFLNGMYRARMNYCEKQIVIGNYDTPEEAFEAYKAYKEKFIKTIAERYKGRIPNKVYEALINWQVEIDD